MPTCSYCRGPITGAGHPGRPWPGRAAAAYCCFGCLSLGEQQLQEATSPQAHRPGWKLDGLGVRLGVGIIVVAQSMIFGLALNLHDDVPLSVRWVAQSVILCATVLVAVLLGGPLVRAAWHELRRGRLTIEALFLLTMTGAMAASVQAHVTGRGKVYFEVVSVLLVVYTLGKLIGARSRAGAVAGSRAWAGQLAACRLVDETGRTRTVPVEEVLPGDVVEVHPGETVAVDGVIRAGTGFVSEAPVSGEPFAVVRRPGDRVLAGAASYDATFRIEATAKGTERQVDRILAAVEESRNRPISLQARADRLGRWFLPLVVFTALGTFGYWTFLTPSGWEAGLFNAMSVLLVACPCVIGLATPVVVWSALGRLAERGLIVRDGDAVERLAEVDRVLFDKTGTLTDDGAVLLDIVTVAEGDERAKLLGWVSLVEAHANHPVARPFARLPRSFPPGEEPRVRSVRAVPGCGVEAEIEEANGAQHILRIGRSEWVNDLASGGREPPVPNTTGGSPCFPPPLADNHRVTVALDGQLAAVAVVAERLRDSAPVMLAEFRRLGLPAEVLTGDTAERAAALDLPAARGGLLPDDKRRYVEELKAGGAKPLMVGDGINDAAALAAAHAGVALASGTDLAVGAAAATLYHADLRVLPWAVQLSRAAVRVARRNLYRALAYNLVGMALAAAGVLHPVVAVLLMVASSLSLLYSSTRVGASALHCDEQITSGGLRPRLAKGTVHFLAVVLQGLVSLALLEPARDWWTAVIGGFAVVGAGLALVWSRWASIPHRLDMCFGMLTLGNLGMLLGWWADNGFAPLTDAGCPACAAAVSGTLAAPGMWVGMLLFANAAMLWLGRQPLPRGNHALAMFTGGNVGMIAGMVAGGWCAAQLGAESVPAAVALGFAGMTAGMLAGMLLGTWLAEGLIRAAVSRSSPVLPEEVVRGEPEPDHDDRVPHVLGR